MLIAYAYMVVSRQSPFKHVLYSFVLFKVIHIWIWINDSYPVFHTANNGYWLVALYPKYFLASKLYIFPILLWQKLYTDVMKNGKRNEKEQTNWNSEERFSSFNFEHIHSIKIKLIRFIHAHGNWKWLILCWTWICRKIN